MTTIASAATTMIGSLPHHNVDAALAMSFQVDIPFLPQIPIRNPWEFMIAQALEGMPGLLVEKDGSTSLDLDVWTGRTHAFNERLLAAFAAMGARRDAFAAFEPSSATSSGWQPFLWELRERRTKIAKLQIAGPLTAQWVLRLKDGSSASKHSDVASQIYRLVLAHALAMCRRLQDEGIEPILYFDEPGLYAFTPGDPLHALATQELKLVVRALRNEGVTVGLHCCSNTHWATVLGLDLNLISIDTSLSLESLLADAELLESYLLNGGRLSLGVIPTSRVYESAGVSNPNEVFKRILGVLERSPLGKNPALVRQTLAQAIYTPTCGLALNSPEEAEAVLSALQDFSIFCRSALA